MEPANKEKTGTGGRWPKGVSGNPSGRPKSARLAQACRNILAEQYPDAPEGVTYADMIALALATKAAKGDTRAAAELRDTAEGKPVQSIQVSPGGDNLAFSTIHKLIAEFTQVTLSAGYEGNEATIFTGTVINYRRGKENNVDSYLDIYAADGDPLYNQSRSNFSLAAGASQIDIFRQYMADMRRVSPNASADPNAEHYLSAYGGTLPRGKVAFGATRDFLRDLADTNSVRWSIQNGVVTLIPLTSYLPGEAVKINSLTGMIGVPEATDNGITVRCLLNPLIKIGHAIMINNRDITQTTIKNNIYRGIEPQFIAGIDPNPNPENDGIYRVLVIEHEGDTRGQSWYTDIVCITIDPSLFDPTQSVANSVLPFGGASARKSPAPFLGAP